MKRAQRTFPLNRLASSVLPATEFPASVAESLPGVPLDPTRWREVLFALLARYNSTHATRTKVVSYKTMEERKTFCYAFFRDLRRDSEKPYRIDPRSLGSRHIEHAVKRWIERDLTPGTIQTYLSHLRVFSTWIGKPGLVLDPERYVENPSLVTRTTVATRDQSWTANEVSIDEVCARIDAIDRNVGAQVRMSHAFGLRVKEAIMIRPHLCVVDGRLAAVHADDPERYIEIVRGTKGGRLRFVAIDSDVKRTALEWAKQIVSRQSDSLAEPSLSLKQAYQRFYYVLRCVGVTRQQLGVTAHGLRHQYANDKYESTTGVPSPVRGGEESADLAESGRKAVAADLGHARLQITNAYLGAGVPRRPD